MPRTTAESGIGNGTQLALKGVGVVSTLFASGVLEMGTAHGRTDGWVKNIGEHISNFGYSLFGAYVLSLCIDAVMESSHSSSRMTKDVATIAGAGLLIGVNFLVETKTGNSLLTPELTHTINNVVDNIDLAAGVGGSVVGAALVYPNIPIIPAEHASN